jgi:signal transduction histidine kinase/CheY-like chemotaxis protein
MWVGALHPDDRQRATDTLSSAWRDRSEFSSEYRVVLPDGTVRWIVDRGRAVLDADGKAVGMAGVNVDITKRRAAEDALRDANRMKDEFLATLSHELRTPLNAIVGWSDMLRRGDLPPEHVKRATEAIYRNAKVQNHLINDVLDVSRIISGKVRIERQPVDPAVVLLSALESVQSAADAKGVAIVTELGPVPYLVAADATRLQQVFWNLLSNAVKFTPSGGSVRVSLRFVASEVHVQVADSGIGINPDFLPHVFERFRQRDSSITRVDSGLGLGLAIVRHLVEMHGGTVTAESAGEGKGATFTVTLPAQHVEERRRGGRPAARHVPVPAVEEVPDDIPSLCGLRVLVIDDEDDARDVASSVLKRHGASVVAAANAPQALEQFALFDPDVLLVDLAMPEVDGYTLLGRLRTSEHPRGAAVPAIALTAYAREEDQRRALLSGFQLHLAKPVDSHTLVRTVASVHRDRQPRGDA